MTNEQLYLATGLPIRFHTAVSLAHWLNLPSRSNDRFHAVRDRFLSINQRFDDKRTFGAPNSIASKKDWMPV